MMWQTDVLLLIVSVQTYVQLIRGTYSVIAYIQTYLVIMKFLH